MFYLLYALRNTTFASLDFAETVECENLFCQSTCTICGNRVNLIYDR